MEILIHEWNCSDLGTYNSNVAVQNRYKAPCVLCDASNFRHGFLHFPTDFHALYARFVIVYILESCLLKNRLSVNENIGEKWHFSKALALFPFMRSLSYDVSEGVWRQPHTTTPEVSLMFRSVKPLCNSNENYWKILLFDSYWSIILSWYWFFTLSFSKFFCEYKRMKNMIFRRKKLKNNIISPLKIFVNNIKLIEYNTKNVFIKLTSFHHQSDSIQLTQR